MNSPFRCRGCGNLFLLNIIRLNSKPVRRSKLDVKRTSKMKRYVCPTSVVSSLPLKSCATNILKVCVFFLPGIERR